jgi:hypothetical protein
MPARVSSSLRRRRFEPAVTCYAAVEGAVAAFVRSACALVELTGNESNGVDELFVA